MTTPRTLIPEGTTVINPPEEFPPATLAASLVGALGELPNIGRDREANIPGKDGKPGYSYRYVDLATLIDHVKPVLTRWGLALLQDVTGDAKTVSVTTVLIHRSGEERHSPPLSMPAGNTPQATGSAITYARRYQAMSVLGLAPDDDDGQAAANAPYREADLSPPVITPHVADGYLELTRKRGFTDAEVREIVLGVTERRTEDVRYLYQTQLDALTDATRAALAAKTTGEAAGSPGGPSNGPNGTDTPPGAPGAGESAYEREEREARETKEKAKQLGRRSSNTPDGDAADAEQADLAGYSNHDYGDR